MRQQSARIFLMCGALCVFPIVAGAADFTCTGTEPFWKLEIRDKGVVLQDGNKVSGQSKLSLKSVKPRAAEGVPPDTVMVFEAGGNERNAKPMTIVVQKREETKCSNGMSDPIFPYDVIVVTQRVVFIGCCENK
jgi:uncharacterized membrane protein